MLTCTFKELEAPPTFQRAQEKCVDNLVIASAGNTAKAFIYSAKDYEIKLYVVVPFSCKDRLVLPFEVTDNVTIIACNSGSDYSDSIAFANRMTNELELINEGGARNVARRAGMGTVMLEAVTFLKKIPEHYFQAVGSGTGAIAAFEAVEYLLNDGRWQGKMPKLHLAQNSPFTPMVDAWNAGTNAISILPEPDQRSAIDSLYAKVLSNRKPPYSIGGGVFDVLKAANGNMYACTNDEAKAAGKMFAETEGIDIVPAACVALASLISAVENNKVDANETILLNITGGGQTRLWEDFDKIKLEPDIVCESDIEMSELKKSLGLPHGREND
jgi:cysteate synthase